MGKFTEAEIKAYEKLRKHYEIENFKMVFNDMKEEGNIPKDLYEEEIDWGRVYDDYYDGVEMTQTKRVVMEEIINKFVSQNCY